MNPVRLKQPMATPPSTPRADAPSTRPTARPTGRSRRLLLAFFAALPLCWPGLGHVSGLEQGSLQSEHYRLQVAGGLQTDDYDRVRAADAGLSKALRELKRTLDAEFAQQTRARRLTQRPAPAVTAPDNLPEQWFDAWITGSSFRLSVAVRPASEGFDADWQAVAAALAAIIQTSTAMAPLLY